MSEITIKSVTKQDTAWRKEITIEREGETHLVILYWDIHNGYELLFKNKNNQTPDWVVDWEDRQQYGDESLEYTLDSLTEDVIEKSYL
jgi:hypothetical protein